MPRLHLGSTRRTGTSSRGRGRPSSSRSPLPPPPEDEPKAGGLLVDASSSSSAAAAPATGTMRRNHDLSSEFDRFDYDGDDFACGGDPDPERTKGRCADAGNVGDYGDADAPPPPPPAATTQKSSLPPKQQRRNAIIYDSDSSSSSSSDDVQLVRSRSAAAPTKKKASTKKKPYNKRDVFGPGGPRKKLKPTASSPKITLSCLSSKNSKKKHTRGDGKMPMGKPVNRRLSKANNARNVPNDENKNDENRQRPNRATASVEKASVGGKGKRKKAPARGGKKQSVSFTRGTRSNNPSVGDEHEQRGKQTVRRVVNCLLDSDEEDNEDSHEEEDEATIRPGKKNTARAEKNRKTNLVRKSETPKERVVVEAVAAVHDAADARENSRLDSSSQRLRRCDPILRVLPSRGIAVDNRAVPTIAGDSAARRSFLGHVPILLEGGLERGVLSSPSSSSSTFTATATVTASFVRGAKCVEREGSEPNGSFGGRRAGASARREVVPRASYLFEGTGEKSSTATSSMSRLSRKDERALWLSDFLAPINDGFEDRDCIDDYSGTVDAGFDYGLGAAIYGSPRNGASDESNYRGPNGFAAEDSWGYFGDLVQAIDRKLSSPTDDDENKSARPVTLFTTDANLFGDVRSFAHIRGLEHFWKRTRQSSTVASVTIVIVETTSALRTLKTIESSYSEADPDAVRGNDESPNSSPLFLPDRLHVMRCANDIQRWIQDLTNETDQAESLSDAATAAPGASLKLQIVEGNTISFQSILQTWVGESFAQTYARSPSCASKSGDGVGEIGGGGVQGRLSFDLPETLDGIMCSVSLDLQYATLPYRIDSLAARGLVEDMRRLSGLSPLSVEVVQTMPLSSVDSSLIYGVPMHARAGLEEDFSRYNEMKMLARQLWKYLSRNDVGLVLRVRGGGRSGGSPDEDSTGMGGSEERGRRECDSFSGCHSSSAGQLLLLVCEEAVEKPQPQALMDHDSDLDPSEVLKVVPDGRRGRRGEAPCHGMLYRYATKSQILRFGNEKRLEEDEAEEEGENSKEVSDHYLDYIERSLDTLVKTGLNPFLTSEYING